MTAIVVTDQTFGDLSQERNLAARHQLTFADYQCRTETETLAAATGARIVFVNFAPITRAVLSALEPGATVIRYGIGFDNVDIAAAKELGIHVCNVPDYGVSTVADHTLALLLTLLRRVSFYDHAIRERGWLNAGDLGPLPSFSNTTISLIGSGRIGRAVISRLQPFGFRVLVHDPFVDDAQMKALGVEPVSFDTAIEQADALTVHVPLNAETHHIVDASVLARMRTGAVLVNTARGGLIDETALATALNAGRIAGAALDVVENEPLPPDSALRTTTHLLLTPHAAFFSDGSLKALQRLATKEADRALSGQHLRNNLT
jgi:D-3-phosphoglycerate dehydrogenase